ncbi:2-oxo-4-hydroxy-4-carboxy-5-ureidoimidazoline decarboxylase [Nocardioides sp.]|uniref:2-oxo-4-hydroxy-4-carboxy-5-ureidoimidazoline decarboxylase n=1 Tax=Nocardioides sp. TaxID=35761 RepID=UPI0039E5A85C
MAMRLDDFNSLPAPEAAAAVRACADIDSFVETLVEGRPYPDLPELFAAARELATAWTPEEVERALADHPRIGERPAGEGASAELSRAEQAGVGDDAELQRRLREGNAAYEARFGRIYLVRAKGRTAEQLLALLDERLANDPATELEVTKGQLGEIALLRLQGMF